MQGVERGQSVGSRGLFHRDPEDRVARLVAQLAGIAKIADAAERDAAGRRLLAEADRYLAECVHLRDRIARAVGSAEV